MPPSMATVIFPEQVILKCKICFIRFESVSETAALLAKENTCVLRELSDVPHRFFQVLVCNIVLLLVPTIEVDHYSDGRTAGCADVL